MDTVLLREGETCGRVARAGRVAFLIDGEEFFGAVASALENARRGVWLLGWDFHSAVRLRRGGEPQPTDELVPLLDALVRRRRALHVRVLAWDFALLYALEREFLPLLHFGAKTHRRVHFRMDSAHPATASQHQKLVVVDDAVAFAGGFDLTTHRWDTREHLADDPRRTTPSGKPYPPFHDVQIAVDGAAAAALADVARERWRLSTGESVAPIRADGDPWPAALEPRVRDVDVGIARTFPAHGGRPEIREVEALYRESIGAARRWIYLENQYLTAPAIGSWLAARLKEPRGPEIVIVGPRANAGWLEEGTMGALRDRVVRALREVDHADRLRVLYPDRPGLSEDQILNVHSKVMVGDDDFARIGSANLSNRSLGLDAECDVAFEAGGREDVARAIAGLRDSLLAEHLGCEATDVAGEIERAGSLVGAVDALRARGERTLRPLELDAGDWAAAAVETLGAIDPEHPVPLEELVRRFEEEGEPGARTHGHGSWGVVALIGVAAMMALAWQVTPLAKWLTPERLAGVLGFFRESWYGPLSAFAAFTVACLALVPVTALIVASGLALGPASGIAVAWLGSIAAAALGHLAGRRLWRETVRRIAGERLNALSRRLGRRGILSSALLRIVPVAPFMIVNLVAGASHVRARDFAVGTALGMLPGTVLLILAADGIRAAFTRPTGPAWLWVALVVVGGVGAIAALRRYASGRLTHPASGS